MGKVLITGGAGFIGLHLAKKLAADGVVLDILDNFSRGIEDPELKALLSKDNVSLLQADLLDRDSVASMGTDYERIFHLAAIIGVANVLDRPFHVLMDNIDMMFNIIDLASRQQNIKRLVYTSTSEVYAGTLKHFNLPLPTPEVTPLALTDLEHPRTSYMLSKIYGEALLQQAGIPFTSIRPHNVYGPRMGMSHVIPELLKKAYIAEAGSELEVFSVDHSRTFCFVSDAVAMLAAASERSKCANQTLNIGVQVPEITIGQLAQVILDIVNKDIIIKALPATPGSPERRCPDMSKTVKLTGIKPKISIEQGIKLTLDWYREFVFDGKGVCAK